MEASELHAKPYRELQQLCKELGLGGKGKKTELVERLLAASHGEADASVNAPSPPAEEREEEVVPMEKSPSPASSPMQLSPKPAVVEEKAPAVSPAEAPQASSPAMPTRRSSPRSTVAAKPQAPAAPAPAEERSKPAAEPLVKKSLPAPKITLPKPTPRGPSIASSGPKGFKSPSPRPLPRPSSTQPQQRPSQPSSLAKPVAGVAASANKEGSAAVKRAYKPYTGPLPPWTGDSLFSPKPKGKAQRAAPAAKPAVGNSKENNPPQRAVAPAKAVSATPKKNSTLTTAGLGSAHKRKMEPNAASINKRPTSLVAK